MGKPLAINKLTRHEFEECSDIPRITLTRLGIFSCSACDSWRERHLSKGFKSGVIKRRDFLSDRHQCSRSRLGKGPIRVRVVCGAEPKFLCENTNNGQVNNKENIPSLRCQVGRKAIAKKNQQAKEIRRNLDMLKTSHQLKELKQSQEQLEAAASLAKKDEYAKQIALKYATLKHNNTLKENLLLETELKKNKIDLDLTSSQLSDIAEKIKNASASLVEYQRQVKAKRVLVSYYDRKNKKASGGGASDEVANVCSSIERAFSCLKGKHAAKKSRVLMEAIMSGNLLQGEAAIAVNDIIKQFISNLFRPWRLVKAGDFSSVGGFKTTTINTLRSVVDHNGVGFFPSASAVNRARALLDQYGADVVGYTRRNTKYGEVYYLNFERAFRLLLRACKLHDLATTASVKVALTVDGADLFKGRTHVSTGIKITDERGIHPITGQPLLVTSRESELDDSYIRVQSKELCCVMVIADAKDSKHLYEDVFKEYYEWGETLRLQGLPASELGPRLLPFTVTHTPDLKGAWFLSNRGGGCKNKKQFCHLCSCTKDSLTHYSVGNFRCDRCKRRNRTKCYHHTVCDSAHGKTYDEVKRKSRLETDHMQVDKEHNPLHIDYIIPVNNTQKQQLYSQFIARECILRGLPVLGDQVEEWRSKLRGCAEFEKLISILEKVRQWKEEGRETVPLVELVELLIPCILHLENRVGEKMITIILRKALNAFLGRKDNFITRMDTFFQSKILGTEESPSQWRLPFSTDSENNTILEHVQVRNNVARCIVKNLDIIIEHSWPEHDHATKSKLIIAITNYRKAMELLTVHRELDEEEIEQFQDYVDDFYEIWIEVFGDEGITNYIHMLGSGHILYFMKKYGCLYLYSQQGWESLNNTIQAFIHQNAQRGGHGSGEGKRKSYIFPLIS